MAERVGFVPATIAQVNHLGLIRTTQTVGNRQAGRIPAGRCVKVHPAFIDKLSGDDRGDGLRDRGDAQRRGRREGAAVWRVCDAERSGCDGIAVGHDDIGEAGYRESRLKVPELRLEQFNVRRPVTSTCRPVGAAARTEKHETKNRGRTTEDEGGGLKRAYLNKFRMLRGRRWRSAYSSVVSPWALRASRSAPACSIAWIISSSP